MDVSPHSLPPSPEAQLPRLNQLARILTGGPSLVRSLEPEPTPEALLEALYARLFANEGFGGERFELGPFDSWSPDALAGAVHYASEIVVRYTELYYDPSRLHVTHYRKQRRVSARLDEVLSPLFREHVRRTGETGEPDLFLNEPIFYFKKEARTRAYPKNKHGRIQLDFLRERFRLLLMHRTAA